MSCCYQCLLLCSRHGMLLGMGAIFRWQQQQCSCYSRCTCAAGVQLCRKHVAADAQLWCDVLWPRLGSSCCVPTHRLSSGIESGCSCLAAGRHQMHSNSRRVLLLNVRMTDDGLFEWWRSPLRKSQHTARMRLVDWHALQMCGTVSSRGVHVSGLTASSSCSFLRHSYWLMQAAVCATAVLGSRYTRC